VEDWLRADEACVVDVDTSRRFLAGHVPGAAWTLRSDLTRPELIERLGWPDRLVLTSSDGYLAAWAAADLGAARDVGPSAKPWLPGIEVVVLDGGTENWARSGRPVESGEGTLLSPEIDVYRRPYEGTGLNPVVMQAYLDWEYGLVDQLRRDGTHGFSVLTPQREPSREKA
jgi:rhodanese-related sulfurtransferase